jgi:hypothetical protein
MGGRLELGGGSGVVAAFDGVALLIVGEGSHQQLTDIAREAAASGASPGRGLARRLAGLLTGDDADAVPAFGALGDAGDGLIVFLYGGVTATTTGPDGEVLSLSGADAATWVDRVLPSGTGPVTLAPVGTDASASGFELGAGIVPGGWLRLVPEGATAAPAPEPSAPSAPSAAAAPPPAPAESAAPAPAAPPVAAPPAATAPPPAAAPPAATAPPPPPPPAPPRDRPLVADPAPAPDVAEAVEETSEMGSVAFESFELTPDTEAREPLPVDAAPDAPTAGAAPPEVEETVPEQDLVEGILCKRQHFNSPDAGFCSTCGISMVHQTHNLVRQKRPPLGFLVFDDGSTFTLDGQYVLGREPETDPLVDGGTARPIVLDDPQASVSRVHAEVRLHGWDVQLVDRGSTNGTHVWNAQSSSWERLAADQPRTVGPGTRGAVGQRTFIYESPHRR